MMALEQMRSSSYKENVNKQIEQEKERNQRLLGRVSQLEKQIKVLINDSVALLKVRMTELGISTTSQNDLLCKAKEIVGRHKELQVMAAKLQNQVNTIEQEQKNLVYTHIQQIAEKYVKSGENIDLTPQTSHELVLKEIANTLSFRKKLQAQVAGLESELTIIEKVTEEKKNIVQTPAVINQPAPVVNNTIPNYPPVASSTPSSRSSSSTSKSHRKNREHRSRSQDWPDVPDVGKIEENNPEILAQKILETGRQIEAGKLLNQKNKEKAVHAPDNALMPAPATVMKVPSKPSTQSSSNSKTSTPTSASKILHESPKVVNFEDRLKSIITSVLNEDQEQRKHHDVRRAPAPPQQQQQQQPQHPTIQTSSIANNLPIVATAHLNASTTISPISSNHGNNPSNSANFLPNYKHQSGTKISPTTTKQKTLHYPQHQNYPAVIYPISHHTPTNGPTSDQHHTSIRELHHEEMLKQEFLKQDSEDIYPRTNSAESGYSRYQQQPPTRPGSSSSQPDYTQVSPAKMALRRHLSQEKLSQQSGGPISGGLASKTIGDLVNGEIERTLEISNQSIINAAVNMSAMLGNSTNSQPPPPTQTPSNSSQSVINWNAQRPERVNCRLNEAGTEIVSYPNQMYSTTTKVPIDRSVNSGNTSSGGHNHGNLATLAHVAYNHKPFNPVDETPRSSSGHVS